MKTILSLLISGAILGIIYWSIDVEDLMNVLVGSRPVWMGVSVGMVVPLTLISAWRFQQLFPESRRLAFLEATRLTLAAGSLNMVLPSKGGDLVKAYFMRRRTHIGGTLALAVVLFEKACDTLALLFWCTFGLVLYPAKGLFFWGMTSVIAGGLLFGSFLISSRGFAGSAFASVARILPMKIGTAVQGFAKTWTEMQRYFWQDWMRIGRLFLTSMGLWFLHLFQIWLFILALGAHAPFLANLALAPLAIFMGLLPLTIAGIGTRDASLIFFYAPYLGGPVAAALGLLCTMRYFLPAIGGLPFLGRYLLRTSADDRARVKHHGDGGGDR